MQLKTPNSLRLLLFIGLSYVMLAGQCRDTRLVNLEVSSLTALTYEGAQGPRYKIQKEDGLWYYAGMEAVDLSAFNAYMQALVRAQGSASADFAERQGLVFKERVILYGTEMAEPTTLGAYAQEGTSQILIHSSAYPHAVFLSDSTGLYKLVFTDLKHFFPHGQ